MSQGQFVWYELATTDLDAAQQFYEHVTAAWSIVPSGMPDMDYRIANVGERGIGGLMPILRPMRDQVPSWRGYIAVDDVDGMADRVRGAGGAVHYGPDDIPSIGRFAVCTDPQGAVFMIFKGEGESPTALSVGLPGAIGWHELYSTDWEAAWPFYAGLFGWEKALAVDMGGMGVYQTFNVDGTHVGGMMNMPGRPPAWIFYITVDDIDAAAKRIAENGGTILHGPQAVPGGAWVVQARDPHGAAFAMTGPKNISFD